MAVTSFATAKQAAPEGTTLVAVLGDNTSAANTGNTRYISFSPKVNTEYVLRYYSGNTTVGGSFPAIYYYIDATGSFASWQAAVTKTANNTIEDRIVYNTVSGITKLMFDNASKAPGFVAIYESTSIGKAANFVSSMTVGTPSSFSPASRGRTNYPPSVIGNKAFFNYAYYSGGVIYTTAMSSDEGFSFYASYGATSSSQNDYYPPSASSNPGKLFISSYNSRQVAYSTDGGYGWTTMTLPNGSSTVTNYTPVVYNPTAGRYIAVRKSNGQDGYAHSTDGSTWTFANGPFVGLSSVRAIGVSNGYFFVTFYNGSNDYSDNLYYSADGLTWTQTTITNYNTITGNYDVYYNFDYPGVVLGNKVYNLYAIAVGSYSYIERSNAGAWDKYASTSGAGWSTQITPMKDYWMTTTASAGSTVYVTRRVPGATSIPSGGWSSKAIGMSYGSGAMRPWADARPADGQAYTAYFSAGNQIWETSFNSLPITPEGFTALE